MQGLSRDDSGMDSSEDLKIQGMIEAWPPQPRTERTADPKVNASDVARRLNITTTTLYAYVNGDGTLKQAGQALID